MGQRIQRSRFVFETPDCPVLVRSSNIDKPVAPFQLNSHEEAEFHLVKQGTGSYLINGARFPFSRNTLITIHPRKVHALIEHQHATARMSLTFQSNWLRLDADERRGFLGFPPRIALNDEDAAVISQVLRRIENELSGRMPCRARMVRLLLRVMLTLVQRAQAHADHAPVIQHPVVAELLDRIREHFADEITVDDLARQSGYSQRHLTRLFKGQTGLSIKQYILQYRVMAARHLIERNPEWTVAAVAERVGFNQYGLFNRVFKSVAGATLAEYRVMVAARVAD